MKVIGITGGIGAGKSLVMELAKERPYVKTVEADKAGHLAMEPGTDSYREIVILFGEEIVRKDHTIDRGKLAGIVFAEEEKLKMLNGIIHPFVRNYIAKSIEEAKNAEKYRYFLLEAAILLETGYQEICDEIWVVTADKEVRKQRLKASRGYSDEKIEAIMKEQMQEKEFLHYADVIIENNGSPEKIKRKLERLLV